MRSRHGKVWRSADDNDRLQQRLDGGYWRVNAAGKKEWVSVVQLDLDEGVSRVKEVQPAKGVAWKDRQERLW